jgi:hypothetical protein
MNNYKKMYEDMQNENRRNYQKFQLLYQWMKLRNVGIRFQEFFVDYQINSAAVYGMGELGKMFYDDMVEQKCEELIKFGIDKKSQRSYKNLLVYELSDLPEKVDCIVISPVLITDEIEDEIFLKLGEIQTFTIEEILYELSRKYHVQSVLWKV